MSSTSNRGTEFEIDAERDEGFFLDSGKTWTGYRVKYRLPGARRWTRFVVIEDEGQTLTVADIERVVEAHSGL